MKKNGKLLKKGIVACFILGIIILVITVAGIKSKASAKEKVDSEEKVDKGYLVIKNTFNYDNRDISYIEKMQNEYTGNDNYIYEDTEYIYEYDDDLNILSNVRTKGNAVNNTNCKDEDSVVEYAKVIFENGYKKFISDEYDVHVNSYDMDNKEKRFTVEFWKKINENVYTSDKLAITISSAHGLEMINIHVNKENINEKKVSKDMKKMLDENSIEDIAYNTIEDFVNDLLIEEKNSVDSDDEVLCDKDVDDCISDAGTNGVEISNSAQDEACLRMVFDIEKVKKNNEFIIYHEYIEDKLATIVKVDNIEVFEQSSFEELSSIDCKMIFDSKSGELIDLDYTKI